MSLRASLGLSGHLLGKGEPRRQTWPYTIASSWADLICFPDECVYNKTQQKQQVEVGKDKIIVRAASKVVS